MWLQKFLDVISAYFPPSGIPVGIEEALARLNPDKFYIENVRSILGVSHKRALQICESAVRQGLISRKVEVLCPDGSVAASAAVEAELPSIVTCWHQEAGHYEEVQLSTGPLVKVPFYQLNDTTPAVLYR